MAAREKPAALGFEEGRGDGGGAGRAGEIQGGGCNRDEKGSWVGGIRGGEREGRGEARRREGI